MRRAQFVLLIPGSLFLIFASWRTGDLPFGPVADVAAHPTIAGLVFASTASGIYRSADAGNQWQRVTDAALNTIAFIPAHVLAFNPFNERELCSLGDVSGACTTNLGETWADFPKPGLNFLLFDPNAADRMYMGPVYGNSWLLISDDHGRTWTLRGSLDVHPWFHGSMAIDKRSRSILETGSPHGGCIPVCSVFRSDDGGTTWSEIVAAEDAWILAQDRAGHSILYFITSDSVSASSDLGVTFEIRGAPPASVTALASDPNNANLLYAGAADGLLFRSDDGGRSWKRIDQSEIQDSSAGFYTRITHISVGIDGTVYVATDHRVFSRMAGRRRAASH